MQEVRPVHDDPAGRGDRVDDRDARRWPRPPAPASAGPPRSRRPPTPRGPSIGAWLKAGLSQVALAPLTLDRVPPARASRPRSTTPRTPSPMCSPQPMVETSRPGPGPGQRPRPALEAQARRHPEGLPLAQRERVFRLDPVHHDPAVRDGREEPPRGAVRGDLRGPAQPRPARRRRGRTSSSSRSATASIRKLKKPARRVAEPILTIALVVLGFTFIPWLAGGRPDRGNLPDRIRDGAEGLEKEIEGEVDSVVDKARKIDVEEARRAGTARSSRGSARRVQGPDPDPDAGRDPSQDRTRPDRRERETVP